MAEPAPPLTPGQFDRYRRHLTLPEMGVDGQRKLLDSAVLLIGAGGLGCPLAQYLAAAGVGHLGLVDDDVVDASNLQRQVLYGTAAGCSRCCRVPIRRYVSGSDKRPHVAVSPLKVARGQCREGPSTACLSRSAERIEERALRGSPRGTGNQQMAPE